MEQYCVMTVGDFKTGKTCFHMFYARKEFPVEYIPTVYERHEQIVKLRKDKTVTITIQEDSCHGEDYDRLRPLSYPGTDAFIALFSVASRESFENVKNRWIPEVRQYRPKVPILIVAHKTDLRRDEACETISKEEGLAMAKEMGTSYYEASSKDGTGVVECFEIALKLAELNSKNSRKKFTSKWRSASVVIPPVKPLRAPDPAVKPAPSTFGDEWRQMISCPKFQDVKITVQGGRSIFAHKLVLCSSSPFFRNILITKSHSIDDINSGKVKGIRSVCDDSVKGQTSIELSDDVKAETFDKIVEFLYTGCLSGNTKTVDISDLQRTAQMFEMNELDVECDGVEAGMEDGQDFRFTDVLKPMAMRKCLEENDFSDVVFNIKNIRIPAHKVVVYARCPKLADVIESATNQEDSPGVVEIPDTTVENFTILLEYLYTDEADLDEKVDFLGLITLAHKYEVGRLVTLCEVKLKAMQTVTEDNAMGLIHKFKKYKTTQLVNFYLHFISTNYLVFLDREELSTLSEEDRKYVEAHRWPPLEYENEKEAFLRDIFEPEKEERVKRCVIL